MKGFALFLLANFALAASIDFLHPSAYANVGGASDRRGTTAQNAIDARVGDCGTGSSFWAFASPLGGGADFWLELNSNVIETTSITIQSCSTGFKDFTVKNSNGEDQVVFSLQNVPANTFGTGTLNGNFLQAGGRITIGVRNKRHDVEHHLNDISFKIEYISNSPPTEPELLSPPSDQTFDTRVPFFWNESRDPDNDTLSYSIQHSPDGVSWEDAGESQCCEFSWNASALEEGVLFAGVRAFDGRQYGARSEVRINIRHEFYTPPDQENAVAGTPVRWKVSAYGSGTRNCEHPLPQDYLDAKVFDSAGAPLQYENTSSEIKWNCNLSSGNNTLYYTTPAVALNKSAWTQDAQAQSTSERQFLTQTLGIFNPSEEGYSNVSAEIECLQGFSCEPQGISLPFLGPAGESNQTVKAEGDGISQSESVDESEYYNKTVILENSLSELRDIAHSFELPRGLEFELFLKEQGEFKRSDNASLSLEKGKATVVFSALDGGTTEILLSARKKNDGQACFEKEECVSGNCEAGLCAQNGEENVLEEPAPAEPPALIPESKNGGEETKEKTASATPAATLRKTRETKTTAHAAKTANPLPALAVFAALAALAAYKKFFDKKVNVKREKNGGMARITIYNKGKRLRNVRVLQMVEENSASGFSIQPTVKQTVTGDLLEWNFEKLSEGEKITVEFTFEGEFSKPLRFQAETTEGKHLCFPKNGREFF
ncbi:MAG: hypothetical protein QXR53_04690 [Candidatus Norongarragalinales archaeon]